MISAETMDTYSDSVDNVLTAMENKARDYIATLSFDNATTTRQSLKNLSEYAKALIASYGDAAASVAAQFYDDLAREAGVKVDPAVLASSNPENIGGTISQIFDSAADETFANTVAAELSKYGMEQANDTIIKNCRRDHTMYARVPTSATPCAFCATLASLGFHYHKSTGAAGSAYIGVNHPHCKCKVVPSFDGDGVEGFAPDAYYDDYKAGRAAADTSYESYYKWKDETPKEKQTSYGIWQTRQIMKGMRDTGAYTH